MEHNLHTELKKYFGFNNFKGLQENVIKSLLDKNDTFVIMPTGGGKSLCYQVPGLLIEGITLVISPLISLIDDQVNALKIKGIPAIALHSRLTQKEYFIEIDNIINGTFAFWLKCHFTISSD